MLEMVQGFTHDLETSKPMVHFASKCNDEHGIIVAVSKYGL